MILKVNIKQIGERRQKVAPIDFEYPKAPVTVCELITETVTLCVNEYNERVRRGDTVTKPLSEEEISDRAKIGKIAFGINYGGKEQELPKAVENALQSFEDGIYRVFLNDSELESLDAPLSLSENDALTFIRLTMLSGRLW